MIKKLVIKGLFGRFNYDILLKETTLTILTGPNGYGKSTILKIIEAFSNFNIEYFNTITFKKIIIGFDDKEKSFEIVKVKNGIKINSGIFEMKNSFNNEKSSINYMYSINEFSKRYLKICGEIDDIVTYDKKKENKVLSGNIKEREYTRWMNIAKNNQYSKSERKSKQNLLDTISEIKESIEEVYFIKEQRLIREKIEDTNHEVVNVIEELPDKFKLLMGKLSESYSQTANALDSTYPTRLFSMEKGINESGYKSKMQDISEKFKKLKEYNILDIKEFSNVIFNEEYAKALKIYFDDFNDKYDVYEEFILKLDLYTRIINERLSFKRVKISKDMGLIIYDIDNEKKYLKLSELSSGEKQEIVLFFELIFDTPNEILLLIDEPEISLHISWQKMFINDLLKITEHKKFNIVVATHSPQIINNHWDKQIDLGELYGN
ncbi:AAA family ATPase [Clostridium estertheticum]|uniref:AAA family ATPase n=1 Tax=Clostridium estertheticum TaxID=238834 RepID=UPI001C7DBD81|nr:AAA family ATPase [Clostridium estertheticum]MBX4268444.1 AAA family ATPase [Clostridium estertheticum]WLC81496.1 AAA family ATPase [Clostridium estertheticum]